MPGGIEIWIVIGVFALLFGSAKLPKLFNNMGRSINEFKAGMAHKPDTQEEDKKIDSVSTENETSKS